MQRLHPEHENPKTGVCWTLKHCKDNLKPLGDTFGDSSEEGTPNKRKCVLPLKYFALQRRAYLNLMDKVENSIANYCKDQADEAKEDNKPRESLTSTQMKNEREAVKMIDANLNSSKLSFDGKEQGDIFVYMEEVDTILSRFAYVDTSEQGKRRGPSKLIVGGFLSLKKGRMTPEISRRENYQRYPP